MSGSALNSVKNGNSRTIAAGKELFRAKPFVWSFNEEFQDRTCANCFEVGKVVKCTGCQFYGYCDKECHKHHWKLEHRHECAMLRTLKKVLPAIPTFDDACGSITIYVVLIKLLHKLKVTVPSLDPEVGKFFFCAMAQLAHEQKVLGGPVASPEKLSSTVNKIVEEVLQCKLQDIIPDGDGACFARSLDTTSINMESHSSDVGDIINLGKGFYWEVLRMTPVCGDFNCEMFFENKTMVVKAVMAIPNFTELEDAQYAKTHHGFCTMLAPRPIRVALFETAFGHACSCKKCTPEFEAEVLPLKCITHGCMEPIPSDNRAWLPCVQCGVINGGNLAEAKDIINSQSLVLTDWWCNTRSFPNYPTNCSVIALQRDEQLSMTLEYGNKMLQKQEHSGILHVENIHYLNCCIRLLQDALLKRKFGRQAWVYAKPMIPFVRRLYPIYSTERAKLLQTFANCGLLYFIEAAQHGGEIKGEIELLVTVLPCLEEAHRTFEAMFGSENKFTIEAKRDLATIRDTALLTGINVDSASDADIGH